MVIHPDTQRILDRIQCEEIALLKQCIQDAEDAEESEADRE